MKQAPVEKYTIAFFRLAEYVSRGEKERALGVYRLLSHSFDDLAFARQLEGDILWSFKDITAQDKYFQAAQLYHKDKRLRQAVGVYEHLLTMHPQSALYVSQLIGVYSELELVDKAKNYMARLLDCAAVNNNIIIISQALLDHENLFSIAERAAQHERFVYTLIKSQYPDQEIIQAHIQKAIDSFLGSNHQEKLEHFYAMLNALDATHYLHAINYCKAKQ